MKTSYPQLPSGRTVLVTGGAKRIGRSMCLAFARRKGRIAIHYDRSQAEAETLVEEIIGLGAEAICIEADLRDIRAVQKLAKDVSAAFPSLDLLINNASTWPDPGCGRGDHGFDQETPEEWDRAFAVNARAPFFLIQRLAPVLLRSGTPQVVNLLDESVSVPFPDRCSHSVSKAALWSVTRLAAEHFAGRIGVHGLELGYALPYDEQSELQAGKSGWCGTDRVVEALAQILQDSDRDAGMGRWHLSGDGTLTWQFL